MKILAIESSCDETAVAVVRDGRTVLSDAILSQADMHALCGGRRGRQTCYFKRHSVAGKGTYTLRRSRAGDSVKAPCGGDIRRCR